MANKKYLTKSYIRAHWSGFIFSLLNPTAAVQSSLDMERNPPTGIAERKGDEGC